MTQPSPASSGADGRAAARRASVAPPVRAQRYLSFVSLAVVVGALGYFAFRYDVIEIPAATAQLFPALPPGRTVVCVGVDASTPVGPGSFVEYEAPAGPRFSQVAGAAGSAVGWRPARGGGLELLLDGRPTGAVWEKAVEPPFPAGPLAADRFLLLDLSPPKEPADARAVGVLPREKLLRKVIFAGWGA
jgi:hypothetical protein